MKTEQMLGLSFNTVVNDCNSWYLNKAFGTPDADIDTGKQTCHIDWELQPEAREHGIKSISIVVNKIVASIEWEVDMEYLSKEEKEKLIACGGTEYGKNHNYHNIGGIIELDSTQQWNGKDWKVKVEFDFSSDGGCMPSDVEINFYTNTITVS
jgi:hypothetical protein